MATGTLTSYDLTTGVKINMDEAIYMISPMDTPLLNGYGSNGNTVLASQAVDVRKFSWMNESALLPRSLAAAAVTTTATTLNVQAGEGLRFQIGDIIMAHTVGVDERMRITGISTDALTITREYPAQAMPLRLVSRSWPLVLRFPRALLPVVLEPLIGLRRTTSRRSTARPRSAFLVPSKASTSTVCLTSSLIRCTSA